MYRLREMRSGVGRGSSLAASMIAAVLLIAPATTVTAQDGGPALAEGDYVVFTGELTYNCGSDVCRFTYTMSDPRLSGDGEAPIDLGCSAGDTCWMGGEVTISNDGGAWQGRWVGFIVEGVQHDHMAWMEGTGDSEGWSYVAVHSDGDGDQRYEDVRGLLYRGDLPPSVADGPLPPPSEMDASE